jgi:hypothetical protein
VGDRIEVSYRSVVFDTLGKSELQKRPCEEGLMLARVRSRTLYRRAKYILSICRSGDTPHGPSLNRCYDEWRHGEDILLL